jgi:serine protease
MTWKTALAATATALAATLGITGAAGIADASAGHAAPARARVPVPRGVTLHPVTTIKSGKPEITVPRRQVPGKTNRLGGGNLLYHGGPVQADPEVYVLFWGLWWKSNCSGQQGNGAADQTYLYNYYHGMGSSADDLSPIASQYSDSTGTHPTFPTAAEHLFIAWNVSCSNPPASATDAQLAAQAASYASLLASEGYTINNNTQIVVVSPSGTNPGGGFGSSYCAYHNWTQLGNGTFLSWTNLPYIPDQGGNCGADSVQNGFDGWSIVGGHEYMESVTDPFVNSPSPGSAWYDDQGFEIGDKCAWTNLFTETLGSWGTFAQQPEWDNLSSNCQPSSARITSAVAGKCLDDHFAGKANGNDVDLWVCNGTGAQHWIAAAGNTLTVFGKCLDNHFGANRNYNEIDIWACNGTGAQKWVHQANGSYLNPATGKCLDDHFASAANGNEIDLYTCNGTKAQKWSGP